MVLILYKDCSSVVCIYVCNYVYIKFLTNRGNLQKGLLIMVFLLRNTTMRDKRNIVHFNLCLALLLASLTFVSGIEIAKDNKVSWCNCNLE